MSAAQPLNSSISVFLASRSFRNLRKFDSVGTIIKRLRPLVMSVPGREITTATVLSRDTTTKDFSTYGRDGFPIVIGLQVDLPFGVAQEQMPSVDFAFQIGADKFLINTPAQVTNDIMGDLQAADAERQADTLHSKT